MQEDQSALVVPGPAHLVLIEERVAALVAKAAEAQAAACGNLEQVLAVQTRRVSQALQAATRNKDLRAAGPQVLALVAAGWPELDRFAHVRFCKESDGAPGDGAPGDRFPRPRWATGAARDAAWGAE